MTDSRSAFRRVAHALAFLFAFGLLAGAPPAPALAQAPSALSVFDKPAPESAEDLRAIQDHVHKVLEKVLPCTVNVRIGTSQGSGVIVSADGYVLTAGHVSGDPGRRCVVTLPDGREVRGETLGVNEGMDSGMVRITAKGEWPHAEMGDSSKVRKGQWCLAVGHPGGYKPGRSPVVRLGRVVSVGPTSIRTDCTLVGGDSGGPLFDMDGKVIGIHSRIGAPITANHHVPVDTYRDTWDRLVRGEAWGGRFGSDKPYYGIQFDPDRPGECRVLQVIEDGPARKAGLKPGDVVLMVAETRVRALEELRTLIQGYKPGDEVVLTVRRGDETLTITIKPERRRG